MSQNDDPTQPDGATPPPYQGSVPPPPPQGATPQYTSPTYSSPTYSSPQDQAPGYQGAGAPGGYQQPAQQGSYQQGAYQQGQYAQAPYPAGQQYGGYPPGQPSRNNGLAIAALVLGLVALVLSFIPFVNIVAILCGIPALVMGVMGLRKAKAGAVDGKGLAIAGLVLGIVAIIISAVVLALTAALVNRIPDTFEEAMEEAANGTDGDSLSEDEQADAAASALDLGESTEIGDYTVAVTQVTQDATDAIAAENEFNAEATGQYVLVRMDVVYTGSDEGTPWIDLEVAYVGTDARQYTSNSCSALIPESAMEVPTLNYGGAAEYNVCMDVPADAIAGGQVFVEELFSFTDERVYWDVE